MKPAKHQFSIFKQICGHIPSYLVNKLANKHGVSKRCRSYSPWSHVVSLIYAQLSHALNLNDICDSQRNHWVLWDQLEVQQHQVAMVYLMRI